VSNLEAQSDYLLEADLVYPDPQIFIDIVKKAQAYIREGDIYQVNLAHKFIAKNIKNYDPFAVYQKLSALNPAPYAGFLDTKQYQIISSSPESFLKIYHEDGNWLIRSCPIKGTARINKLNELISSEKERAEHIMIVDLIRNDLGRVCEAGSIQAKELLGVYQFKNLYHFISRIEGKLKKESEPNGNLINSLKSILGACFPGGSISGTPKIRALEIIDELEPCPRGPYTGAMGYFRFSDGGEFNILIRSLVYDKVKNELSFHSGGGITADSDPERELEETMIKAEKLIELFDSKHKKS